MIRYQVRATDGDLSAYATFAREPVTLAVAEVQLHRPQPWGEETISIPAAAVDHVQGNTIYLKLSRRRAILMPASLTYR